MSNNFSNMINVKVTNFKPARGYILVKRNKEETLRASGIYTIEKEKSMRAIVIALGSPMLTVTGDEVPMNVKVGDDVLMEMYQITEVNFGGEIYILTKEETISCIFEEECAE